MPQGQATLEILNHFLVYSPHTRLSLIFEFRECFGAPTSRATRIFTTLKYKSVMYRRKFYYYQIFNSGFINSVKWWRKNRSYVEVTAAYNTPTTFRSWNIQRTAQRSNMYRLKLYYYFMLGFFIVIQFITISNRCIYLSICNSRFYYLWCLLGPFAQP